MWCPVRYESRIQKFFSSLLCACLAAFRTFVTTMEDVEGEGARCNSSLNVLNTIRVGLLNREDNDNHNEYSGINVSE